MRPQTAKINIINKEIATKLRTNYRLIRRPKSSIQLISPQTINKRNQNILKKIYTVGNSLHQAGNLMSPKATEIKKAGNKKRLSVPFLEGEEKIGNRSSANQNVKCYIDMQTPSAPNDQYKNIFENEQQQIGKDPNSNDSDSEQEIDVLKQFDGVVNWEDYENTENEKNVLTEKLRDEENFKKDLNNTNEVFKAKQVSEKDTGKNFRPEQKAHDAKKEEFKKIKEQIITNIKEEKINKNQENAVREEIKNTVEKAPPPRKRSSFKLLK